jgi:hypothetical protein
MNRPEIAESAKRFFSPSDVLALLPLGLAFALATGCEGGGLSGEDAFVGQTAHPDSGYACQHCVEDIVPDPVDCAAAEEGVQFLPITIYDFEAGVAGNMYGYYDGSASEYIWGATFNDDGTVESEAKGWQPPSDPAVRCLNHAAEVEQDPNAVPNRAFHFKAGPFTNWGGGIGRTFKCMNNADSIGTGTVKAWDGFGGPYEAYKIARACDAADSVRACATVEQDPNDEPQDEGSVLARSACPERDKAFLRSDEDVESLEDPEEEYLLGMTLDLSEWDGISFWGRRSNDADAGLRLVLGDKYTSDDLSFLQYHINPDSERQCERTVECGCAGDGACTLRTVEEGGDGSFRCYDSPPVIAIGLGETRKALDRLETSGNAPDSSDLAPLAFPAAVYEPCGPAMCGFRQRVDNGELEWRGKLLFGEDPLEDDADEEYYAAFGQRDYQIVGKECHPYTTRGGLRDKFCFDPESGEVPADGVDKCGDHWVHPVRLSDQWQFYKVRFDQLLQEGWAKESFKLDLTTLMDTRFTFGTGYADFWIDDVRVYRDLHNSTAK